MCVAVVVDTKKQIPLRHLKAMESANPDGGGVAWVAGNYIMYRKGLTAQEIFDMQDNLPRPFFMHFRIATRGAKIPELTHPFPLGMQAFSDDLTGLAPAVLMHNGTWSDFRKYVPEGIKVDDVSDTQTAAYACDFDEDILDEVGWSNAIMRAVGNGRCNITLRGRWTEGTGDEAGIHYSNQYWRSELWSKPTYSHQANYRSYGPNSAMARNWDDDEWTAYWNDRTPIPARTVTPLVPRRKGFSHQENSVGQLSKRQQKRLAKAARRAEKKAQAKASPSVNDNKSNYDKALEEYNKNRNAYWNSDGPLFTPDALKKVEQKLKSEKECEVDVPCPDCGREIETIPCSCNEWTAEQWIAHNHLEDAYDALDADADSGDFENIITEEIAVGGATELENLESVEGYHDHINLSKADTNDVEDMNAYGMACGLDSIPDTDLVLDPHTPEEWKTVDEYIRKQGIKI